MPLSGLSHLSAKPPRSLKLVVAGNSLGHWHVLLPGWGGGREGREKLLWECPPPPRPSVWLTHSEGLTSFLLISRGPKFEQTGRSCPRPRGLLEGACCRRCHSADSIASGKEQSPGLGLAARAIQQVVIPITGHVEKGVLGSEAIQAFLDCDLHLLGAEYAARCYVLIAVYAT